MKKVVLVILVAATVAAAGLFLFSSCSKRPIARQQARAENNPGVPIMVATVQQKETSIEIGSFGNVEAYASVDVKAQVTGILTRVHFTEGQMVKKGDLLLSIDPRQPQTALSMAQANLERDQAQLKNAEKEAARQTELFQKGIASQNDYDNSTTAVEVLRAAVSADKAAIENAGLQLDYCSIRSPIDGCTGSLRVNQGNLVKANDVSVVNIVQIDPIYVSFWIPQQNLPTIQKQMAINNLNVRVSRSGEDEQPIHGVLSLVDNAVDVSSRTIHLRATFSNKDQRLWPGQYVDVVLTIAHEPNSVVAPSQSVQTGQNGRFVYVIKSDQTVEARPVTVKRTMDNESVVEGVLPGEAVVTDGQLRLVPGAKVQVKNSLQE